MPTTLDTHHFADLASAVRFLVDQGFAFWRDDDKGTIYRNGLAFAVLFPAITFRGNECWGVDLPRKYH